MSVSHKPMLISGPILISYCCLIGIDRILGGEDSAEQASPLLSPVSPYTPTTGNTTGNLSTLHPAFKAGYHQRESEATAVDPSTLDLPEGNRYIFSESVL